MNDCLERELLGSAKIALFSVFVPLYTEENKDGKDSIEALPTVLNHR